MDGPAIAGGAVAFAEGKILAAGRSEDVLRSHRDATIVDTTNAVVVPGLVNAHTHLELGLYQRSARRPGSFTAWIKSMRDQGRQSASDPGYVARAVRAGVAQCLRFGVTAV